MTVGDFKDVAAIAGLTDLGASPNGTHVLCQGAAPGSWLLCNGAEVLKATYAGLFAVIADAFGTPAGGSSYFCLPDFRGKVPAFYNGDRAPFTAIGATTPGGLLHATVGAGDQNLQQALVIGGRMIKV